MGLTNKIRNIVKVLYITTFCVITMMNTVAYGQILESDAVTVETANAYLEQCLGNFPRNFTPKAHKDFCNCSAANVRANMTNTDLEELNKEDAQKAGNISYEKFIVQVISPCMAVAVDHIGYFSCIEDRSHNPYIDNIRPYCQCAGLEVKKFVRSKGAPAIIINMTKNPQFFNDPVQTLLTSREYKSALNTAYHTCKPIGKKKRLKY